MASGFADGRTVASSAESIGNSAATPPLSVLQAPYTASPGLAGMPQLLDPNQVLSSGSLGFHTAEASDSGTKIITTEERARIAEERAKIAEAKLAALEAKVRQQQDHMTGYAHDANNMLAAIAATLMEAAEASTVAETTNAVRNAQTLLARQTLLMSQLFETARHGHDAPKVESVNLASALAELAKILEIPAKKKSLNFALHSEIPAMAAQVKADWLALSRVLSNLIGNATKFTERGGITLTVKANVASDTQVHLAFSIKDTGIGMTEEEAKRLFQRFVQANDEVKTTHGGSGFGLYYCQNTVRSMGGDITITSTKGVGTEFNFSIVCERAIALEAGARNDAKAPVTGPIDLKGKTVLIVEDDGSIAKLVKRTLEKQGVTCVHVSSAAEALALGQELHTFDIALVDNGLPGGKNGLELAQEIRAAGFTMPIIASSGEADDPSFQRQAAAIGFNACLPKPYSASALPRFISDTIRAVAPATPTRTAGGAGISAITTVSARPPVALSTPALVTAPVSTDGSSLPSPALAFAKSLSGNGSFSPHKRATAPGSEAIATESGAAAMPRQ